MVKVIDLVPQEPEEGRGRGSKPGGKPGQGQGRGQKGQGARGQPGKGQNRSDGDKQNKEKGMKGNNPPYGKKITPKDIDVVIGRYRSLIYYFLLPVGIPLTIIFNWSLLKDL